MGADNTFGETNFNPDMKTETKPDMKAEEAKRGFVEKYKTSGYRVGKDYAGGDILRQVDNSDEILSDLNALLDEHYYPKEKYDELLRQEDQLKEALFDMTNQFAYQGRKDEKDVLHTGGLSALESAFDALNLSDPITVTDFITAINER